MSAFFVVFNSLFACKQVILTSNLLRIKDVNSLHSKNIYVIVIVVHICLTINYNEFFFI